MKSHPRRVPRLAWLVLSATIAAPTFAQTMRQIPGTSVTMAVPPGFKVTRSSGLENGDNGSNIQLAESSPSAYAETIAVFSSPKTAATRYAPSGTRIARIEQIEVEGGQAPLAIGSQVLNGKEFTKYIAVLGGEQRNTVLINFNIAGPNALTRSEVEAAVRSVRLARVATLDEKIAKLSFTFNVVEPFRTADVLGGGTALLASFEGKDPAGMKPIIMIGRVSTTAAAAQTRALAEQVLRSMAGFADAPITEQAPTTFAGGAGQYLSATAADRTIVQYLRVLPGGTYIRLVARSEAAAMDDVRAAIKAIAESVQLAE